MWHCTTHSLQDHLHLGAGIGIDDDHAIVQAAGKGVGPLTCDCHCTAADFHAGIATGSGTAAERDQNRRSLCFGLIVPITEQFSRVHC